MEAQAAIAHANTVMIEGKDIVESLDDTINAIMEKAYDDISEAVHEHKRQADSANLSDLEEAIDTVNITDYVKITFNFDDVAPLILTAMLENIVDAERKTPSQIFAEVQAEVE